MDRKTMLCAVTYLISRESDALAYRDEPLSIEEQTQLAHLRSLEAQVAKDAGAARSQKRWRAAVKWVTEAE